MKTLQLSIIITYYQTPHFLLNCLKAIQENLNSIKYEVFVCDAEANAGTAFLIQYNHPKVQHLAFKKNVGYARLVNKGIENAQGRFILILNADTVIEDENSIKRMMKFLEENERAGIVGPKLINIDGTFQKSFFREYTLGAVLARRTLWKKTRWGKKALEEFEFQKKKKNTPFEVDWIMGSAMMTKKELIDKIGKLDTRYFMYFEDVDWCRRFREAGYKVYYLPNAQIRHFHLKESDSKKGILDILANKLTRIHILSYFKYLIKWNLKKS